MSTANDWHMIESPEARSESKQPILLVDRLHKSFGGVRAVWDVSFEVLPRQTVGLIGPNGSGKTTLLNLIAGLFRSDAGNIVFNGEDCTGYTANQIARRGVVRTWQDPRVVPDMTVRQNVSLGRIACRRDSIAFDIDAVLYQFGLSEFADSAARILPYGQQKLLALARSLAALPTVLLLDEPLAGLSALERQKAVLAVQTFGKVGTVLIVDHAFGVISQLCDKMVVLNAGTKLVEGPPAEIAKNQNVIEVYFG